MNKTSNTDWQQVAAMKDEEIDLSDIPELDDEFFQQAEIRIPPKKSVTMRLDSDVIAFLNLRVKWHSYQTRINKLLRNYMDVQLHRIDQHK